MGEFTECVSKTFRFREELPAYRLTATVQRMSMANPTRLNWRGTTLSAEAWIRVLLPFVLLAEPSHPPPLAARLTAV